MVPAGHGTRGAPGGHLEKLIQDTPLDQLHAKLPELRRHLQAALEALPAPARAPSVQIEAAAVKSLEAVHARRLEAAKLCHELRHLPGLSRTGAFQPIESGTLRGKTLVSGSYKHSLLRVVMRASTLLEILAEPANFDVERMNESGNLALTPQASSYFWHRHRSVEGPLFWQVRFDAGEGAEHPNFGFPWQFPNETWVAEWPRNRDKLQLEIDSLELGHPTATEPNPWKTSAKYALRPPPGGKAGQTFYRTPESEVDQGPGLGPGRVNVAEYLQRWRAFIESDKARLLAEELAVPDAERPGRRDFPGRLPWNWDPERRAVETCPPSSTCSGTTGRTPHPRQTGPTSAAQRPAPGLGQPWSHGSTGPGAWRWSRRDTAWNTGRWAPGHWSTEPTWQNWQAHWDVAPAVLYCWDPNDPYVPGDVNALLHAMSEGSTRPAEDSAAERPSGRRQRVQ